MRKERLRRQGRPSRAGGRLLAALVVALLLGAGAVPPVAAADPVSFGTPSASSMFGKSIDFVQPVDLATQPKRVEILLSTPGSIGPEAIQVPTPSPAGKQDLRYSIQIADGHVAPNTTFVARWRVTDTAGKSWLGPAVTHVYADRRFAWQTVGSGLVRLHWYKGGADFGKRALKIGEDAVRATSSLLGVTESAPIDFFVYADQQPFHDALGPATRENVGGQAHPDIRTMFALITPAEINASWVESVVPHELTHLVFDTATKNPYHDPPHWLNEGLAVYLSDGYSASYKQIVASVAADGTIIPLGGLAGAFPTTRDGFVLGYAESTSAVDRIVRTYGRDALVKLIRSYHDGRSDDEAFKAALGVDTVGFEAGWLKELGAKAAVRYGPKPAPPGPVPSGWSGPVVAPSVVPGANSVPAPTAAPGTPEPVKVAADMRVVGAIVGLLAAVAAIGVVIMLRRRSMGRSGP